MFVSKHRAMPKAKPNRWDSSSIVLHAGEARTCTTWRLACDSQQAKEILAENCQPEDDYTQTRMKPGFQSM